MSESEEFMSGGAVATGGGFRMSPTIGKVAGALAKAQGVMRGAAKDATNPHYKNRYADLASIWDACREALTANELAVLQPVYSDGARVTVVTILTHSSGEWVSGELTVTAQQNTPQGVGSAITYARRYGLAAMVGVAPDDDDGEGAEGRPSGGGDYRKRSAPSTPASARTVTAAPPPPSGSAAPKLSAREELETVILSCNSRTELATVVGRIKTLPSTDQDALREVYKRRHSEVK